MRKALLLTTALLGCASTQEITQPEQRSNATVAAEASAVRERAQNCLVLQKRADTAISNQPCGDEQFINEAIFHWECVQRDPALAAIHENLHGRMAKNVDRCAVDSSIDAVRLKCLFAMNEYAEKFREHSTCDSTHAQQEAFAEFKKICGGVRLSLENPDRRLQDAYNSTKRLAVADSAWCNRGRNKKNPETSK